MYQGKILSGQSTKIFDRVQDLSLISVNQNHILGGMKGSKTYAKKQMIESDEEDEEEEEEEGEESEYDDEQSDQSGLSAQQLRQQQQMVQQKNPESQPLHKNAHS